MAPMHRPRSRKAFTLLEMLIVIGIITLLAAILIPVVSQVRMRAFVAQTQGEMQRIMMACQAYYHDFNAYPGPLANSMIATNSPATTDPKIGLDPAATAAVSVQSTGITSSENLTLGLLGLLSPYPAASWQNPPNNALYMPPPPKHDVMSLNYVRPASYHYLDFLPDEVTNHGQPDGTFGGAYTDSTVPEFVDHIPGGSVSPTNSTLPILYMRAAVKATIITSADGKDPNNSSGYAAYNYNQLYPYGFTTVTQTDFPPPAGVTETHNGWDVYLMNPSIPNQPRGKDTFVLICAGVDRVFGTKDDIFVTP